MFYVIPLYTRRESEEATLKFLKAEGPRLVLRGVCSGVSDVGHSEKLSSLAIRTANRPSEGRGTSTESPAYLMQVSVGEYRIGSLPSPPFYLFLCYLRG